MDIKIIIATHKEYRMPGDTMYLPLHVGCEGKNGIGFMGDNTGDNISSKNPYYCELTGLYWAWKNLECDYLGLAHYRRHFTAKSHLFNRDKFDTILTSKQLTPLLEKYDVVLPKKRNYMIESVYDHYVHTHYPEPLDETEKIIAEFYPEYSDAYEKVMKRKKAHMFNMYIMKKTLSDNYCQWLFDILEKLESRIDITDYNAFQARLYGRISELLLDVWIEKNGIRYTEIPVIHMEKVNWFKKGFKFIDSKIRKKLY